MRIAYIYQFLTMGGVSVQLRNRIRYLSDQNVNCACFFLHDRGGRLLHDIAPVTVDDSASRLLDKVDAWTPDFLVTIDSPQVYGNLERRNMDCCWINEMHTTTRIAKYYSKLQHMNNVRGFIVPSAYLKNFAVSDHGLDADRIRVVPNCVDTSLFCPTPVQKVPDQKILCWIGKLDAHKNWRQFVALCSRIANQRDDVAFWLVGGDTATHRVVSQLLEALSSSNLLGKVHWIDGVEQERMPYLLSLVSASGGALVVTSRNESFGMTVLEAMACKCPVVCSRVGAIPELVTHGKTGLLYEKGDLDGLTAAVKELIDDKEYRSRVAEQSYRGIEERFSLESVGMKYLDTLRSLSLR